MNFKFKDTAKSHKMHLGQGVFFSVLAVSAVGLLNLSSAAPTDWTVTHETCSNVPNMQGSDGNDLAQVDGVGGPEAVVPREAQDSIVIIIDATGPSPHNCVEVLPEYSGVIDSPEGVAWVDIDPSPASVEWAIAIANQGQTAAGGRNTTMCFQNPDMFNWTCSVIPSTQNNQAQNQVIAEDLDGDGDYEIITGTRRKTIVTTVGSDPHNTSTYTSQFISTDDNIKVMGLGTADYDQDGDLDIGFTGRNSGVVPVGIIENVNGLGTSWNVHVLDNIAQGRFPDFESDWDGDGDIDIVTGNPSGVDGWTFRFYENPGTGALSGWQIHEAVTNPFIFAQSVIFVEPGRALANQASGGRQSPGDFWELTFNDPKDASWSSTQLTFVECKNDNFMRWENFFFNTIETLCLNGLDSTHGGLWRFEFIGGGPPPPDTTPPVRSNGLPSGNLPAGTIQVDLSLDTNEVATCRYSTVAGTDYTLMVDTFITTGTTSHSTTVGGLVDGQSYDYYVRCEDVAGNANTTDFPIQFSVDVPDVVPPVRSNGSPVGTLPAGTTSTTMALDTDEVAVCRYSTVAGTDYASMVDTFVITGGTSHSTPVNGLVDGQSYEYFVRCQDVSGNANITDFSIQFSVDVPVPDTTPPVRSNGSPTGTLPFGTTSTQLALDTDETATCRYSIVAGTEYASMVDTFSTTGGTSHSTIVNGLVDGQSYEYFVRCEDVVGNANTTDFPIQFSVDVPPPPGSVTDPFLLAQGGSTTVASSHQTASLSPSANALLMVGWCTDLGGTNVSHDSIIDDFADTLTWIQFGGDISTGRGEVSLFYTTLDATPGSGTVTVSYSASVNRASWIAFEVTGQNIADPISEYATASAGSGGGSTQSVTLADFAAGNKNIGVICDIGNQDVAPGAGETELAEEENGGSSAARLQVEYGTDTTLDWSNLDRRNNAAIGFEVQ